MVRQINKMHDKEIALNDKIKLVDNGIKSQFENMIYYQNRHRHSLR